MQNALKGYKNNTKYMEEGHAGVVCKKEVHMKCGNRKYKCKYMIIWFLNISSIWKKAKLKKED